MIEFYNRSTGKVEDYDSLFHAMQQDGLKFNLTNFIDVAMLLHAGLDLIDIAVKEPDLALLAGWLYGTVRVEVT